MGVLDGKIAIVTGTSRGVGVGIAHELLRAGATVIGCSRSPLDTIPGVDADPSWTARASQKVCDQGDYRSIDSFVADVVATHGRIDILVNNAGGTVPAPLEMLMMQPTPSWVAICRYARMANQSGLIRFICTANASKSAVRS